MKAIFRGLSVSLLALTAAGCSTPNPTALDKPNDVPVAFTAPIAKDAPIWPDATWWANFKTDELPALEESAQKENLDIAAANARILEAEAEDEIAFAPLLPTVNLPAIPSRRSCRVPIPWTSGA
jgi:multidrug efflux system outer membrane protein